MTNKIFKYIFTIILLCTSLDSFCADNKKEAQDNSVRKERNFIRSGNKLFEQERYSEAEVEYRKALQVNQSSEIGMYNLATTLMQIGGKNNANDKKNPTEEAVRLLGDLTGFTNNKALKAKAFYNLGNWAYGNEQYQEAVNFYKRSLRANPYDEECRQNLRLAQLKLQNQSKDDSKKDDKQDQKEQQQQQQQQQQNKPQQQPQQQQNQQQQQQSGAMSADNAEQILKAMQNSEQNTQKKVNASRSQQEQNERRRTRNQW